MSIAEQETAFRFIIMESEEKKLWLAKRRVQWHTYPVLKLAPKHGVHDHKWCWSHDLDTITLLFVPCLIQHLGPKRHRWLAGPQLVDPWWHRRSEAALEKPWKPNISSSCRLVGRLGGTIWGVPFFSTCVEGMSGLRPQVPKVHNCCTPFTRPSASGVLESNQRVIC
jgi:hypothetical protein